MKTPVTLKETGPGSTIGDSRESNSGKTLEETLSSEGSRKG